jgi:hypothetical protein
VSIGTLTRPPRLPVTLRRALPDTISVRVRLRTDLRALASAGRPSPRTALVSGLLERHLGEHSGRRCPDKGGKPRSTYLYHVVDNQWSMAEYGHQCVVWQTAVNPVVALELLANGTWSGSGILGPEAFDSAPFLELLTAYGSPWGQQELTP